MKSRGAITLAFDDGYQTVLDQVIPLLASYNVQAVFAVPLKPNGANIEQETVAPYTQWLEVAKDHGHEIAAHGISHTDLTTLTDTELQSELQEPAATLQATTIVYPGGAHNDRVISRAKKIYTGGRTVLYGLETLPPKNPMKLHTINFSKRNFSVVRANIHALRAYLQGRWLIETYHMVQEGISPLAHSVLLDELDAHLDFVTSLPIRIGTIKDIV